MAETGSAATAQTEPLPFDGFDKIFLNGEWRQGRSEKISEDLDPYTGEVLVRIPLADERDLNEAFGAAASAQESWGNTLPAERAGIVRRAAAIMEERREELVGWLIRESGSTRIKAEVEWQYAHAVTLEASTFPTRADGMILPVDIPGKESRVYRRPVGVVGMISPWNFPLHLSSRSVAPALALGNTVVVKPASDTPVTGGLLLAKIYEEAGLPAGVLNVVVGSGSVIGDAFVKHPVPRVISFTGSTEVGRRIAELAAQSPILKRVVLELGGNSPCVVLDDADIDLASRIALFGKFLHQGQICMAINRLIVDEKVFDEFADAFVAGVGAMKVGDPSDERTVVGPLINRQQLEKLQRHIEQARSEGARELAGGGAELSLGGGSSSSTVSSAVWAWTRRTLGSSRRDQVKGLKYFLRHALEVWGGWARPFQVYEERGGRVPVLPPITPEFDPLGAGGRVLPPPDVDDPALCAEDETVALVVIGGERSPAVSAVLRV